MLKGTLRTVLITISLVTPIFANQSRNNTLRDLPRNTNIYVASIQFPPAIKELPDIRAYFAGTKPICEKDNALHRLLFTISAERTMLKLYILVAENPSFHFDETVQYLKQPNDAYKLWSVELMHKKQPEASGSKTVGGIKLNKDESPYSWIIHEQTIDEKTGKIPDNTLVIKYNPKLVDHLEGGSGAELPKIMMASNILELVGSKEKLHDLSISYVLSALDLDTIHARCEQEIKYHPNVNRITVCTT